MLPTLDEFKRLTTGAALLAKLLWNEAQGYLTTSADIYLKERTIAGHDRIKYEHTTNCSPSLNMKMLNALSAPVRNHAQVLP